MRVNVRYIPLAVIIGFGLAVASCDKTPNTPNAPTPPVQQPPSAPTIVRTEIVAPVSVEPGKSVQLTANVVKSDGAVENVSSRAQWSSTDSRVLRVDSTGLATGVAPGEVTVAIAYQGSGASSPVMVLPAGTFRLKGVVTESGIPLQSVRIQVLDGTGKGLTTVTTQNGEYSLYGVGGEVRLHLKRNGYLNRIEALQIREHRVMKLRNGPRRRAR